MKYDTSANLMTIWTVSCPVPSSSGCSLRPATTTTDSDLIRILFRLNRLFRDNHHMTLGVLHFHFGIVDMLRLPYFLQTRKSWNLTLRTGWRWTGMMLLRIGILEMQFALLAKKSQKVPWNERNLEDTDSTPKYRRASFSLFPFFILGGKNEHGEVEK